MTLFFVSSNDGVVDAYYKFFHDLEETEYFTGTLEDFIQTSADWQYLITPGNSFGIMDGGFDLAVVQQFGSYIQDDVTDAIHRYFHGIMPIGSAETFLLPDDKYLIYAPTMELPRDVSDTFNAFWAAYASFDICSPLESSIIIPGLCTGAGQMDPLEAARQVRMAYDVVVNEEVPEDWHSIYDFFTRESYSNVVVLMDE
jgi:O-acetyl-ADP-ribose deacetylase (regulator of RNase III)